MCLERGHKVSEHTLDEHGQRLWCLKTSRLEANGGWQSRRMCARVFQNLKISNIDRRMLEPTKKETSHTKTKKKLQQDTMLIGGAQSQ